MTLYDEYGNPVNMPNVRMPNPVHAHSFQPNPNYHIYPQNRQQKYKRSGFKKGVIGVGKRKGEICFTGFCKGLNVFITVQGKGSDVKVFKSKKGNEFIRMIAEWTNIRTKQTWIEPCLYNKTNGKVIFSKSKRVGNPHAPSGYTKKGKHVSGYLGTYVRR